MKSRLLVIFLVLGTSTIIYPTSAFACSLAFDISFLNPWNEYLHGDCSVTTGAMSWTGMIYIMLAFIVLTIIIKRKKKLSKKIYLIIPAIIFIVMMFYSVFIYGTTDITQFAVPRGIYGGIDYDTVAWLDTKKDFKRILGEKNIIFSNENFNTTYDYAGGVNSDNIEYQIIMPANYCGFVISDEGEEYWYTATFDKIITSSELHEANPYDCSGESKECACSMQESMRKRFLENED